MVCGAPRHLRVPGGRGGHVAYWRPDCTAANMSSVFAVATKATYRANLPDQDLFSSSTQRPTHSETQECEFPVINSKHLPCPGSGNSSSGFSRRLTREVGPEIREYADKHNDLTFWYRVHEASGQYKTIRNLEHLKRRVQARLQRAAYHPSVCAPSRATGTVCAWWVTRTGRPCPQTRASEFLHRRAQAPSSGSEGRCTATSSRCGLTAAPPSRGVSV